MSTIGYQDVVAARGRIAALAATTPLVPAPGLSGVVRGDVCLKLETTQPTGAFKLRGAANAVLSLDGDVAGVTCCSTGNHGRAVAYAARERGLRAVVFMSSLVPANKLDAIRALGAEVRIVGGSQDDALAKGLSPVREEGLVEIPPFDDPLVIAGQATIGCELVEQMPDVATVLVPLSGGGLASGVALATKALRPDCRVIGISMDRGAAMYESLEAGHPVEVTEVASLADSLGGGIGLDNRLSFALCRDLLDDVVLVTEDEIYRAMQALYWEERLVCEGAAVVGAAALMARKVAPAGSVALIVTGRNVDMGQFTAVVTGKDVLLGEITVRGTPYGA